MANNIDYNGQDKWKQKATELLNQGGGGGGGNVDDVKVNGTSVVDENKVAQIDLTPYAESADLATVATTGSYDDLTDKPTIPAAQVQSDWTESDNTKKSYIKNKPTIPSGQVQSDWAQDDSTEVDFIKNKPTLANVATSGSYDDLSDKPTIPSDTTYIFSEGSTNGAFQVTPSGGTAQTVYVHGVLTSHQSVTDNNPTLAWNTKSKVATIGGTEIHITMPANPNTNTTYTIASGDGNGQIKVTPSSGSAYNVSVKGLGSAAYLTASTSATANTVAKRQGNGYLYAVYYNTSCGSEDPGSYTSYAAFIDSNGWLRKSSRLNFAKYLTNQQIASPGYFVTLTNSWGSFGYSTPAQARSGLGLGGCATQSISYHTVSCNIPSGSLYKDYSVTYSRRTVDAVIPCIWTGTTSQANVCIPVITNVTATSTTIRVWKQVGASTNNPEPALKVLIVYH